MKNNLKSVQKEKGTRWLDTYRFLLLLSIAFGVIGLGANVLSLFASKSYIFLSVFLFLEFVARLILRISTYRSLGRLEKGAYMKTCILLTWDGITFSLYAFIEEGSYAVAIILFFLYFGIWWLPNFIYFRKRSDMFNQNNCVSPLTMEKIYEMELRLKECIGDDIFASVRDRLREIYCYQELLTCAGQNASIYLTHDYIEALGTVSDYYNYDAFLLLQELIQTQSDQEQKSILQDAAEKVKKLLPFEPSVPAMKHDTVSPEADEEQMNHAEDIPTADTLHKQSPETVPPYNKVEKRDDDMPSPESLQPFSETAREKAALQMYEEAYQKAFHSENIEEIKHAFDKIEYIADTTEFIAMRAKAKEADTSNAVKPKQKKTIIALAVVCAVFFISTIALSVTTYTANQKAKGLQVTVKKLSDETLEQQNNLFQKDKEIRDLTEKYVVASAAEKVLDRNIAFVAKKSDDRYHKYSCFVFRSQIRDGGSYWMYFTDDVGAYGYSPCPYCH